MSTKDLFGIPKYTPFERMNDWTSSYQQWFTFAPGYGTLTTSSIVCKREGDSLKVRGTATLGTVAASAAYIQLPSGLNIDYSKLPTTAGANTMRVGLGNSMGGSLVDLVTSSVQQVLFVDGTTLNQIFFAYQENSFAYVKNNCSNLSNNQDVLTFEFEVPIKEFSL